MALLRGLFSESHIFTKNSQNFGFKPPRKIGLRVRGFFPAPREPCQLHIRNLKYVRRCARRKLASDKGRHARTVWTQAMGAARRDPRRGEIPVTRGHARFQYSARIAWGSSVKYRQCLHRFKISEEMGPLCACFCACYRAAPLGETI